MPEWDKLFAKTKMSSGYSYVEEDNYRNKHGPVVITSSKMAQLEREFEKNKHKYQLDFVLSLILKDTIDIIDKS